MSRHTAILLLLVCCVTFVSIEAVNSELSRAFQRTSYAQGHQKQYVKPKYTNVFIESASTVRRRSIRGMMKSPQDVFCFSKKCPFPEGICCPNDRNACCPKGYSCLTKAGSPTQCVAGDDDSSGHKELNDLKQQNFNTGSDNPVVVVDIDARRKQEQQAIEQQREKVAQLQVKEEAEKHTAKMEQKNHPASNPDALAQQATGTGPAKTPVDSPISSNEAKQEQQAGAVVANNNNNQQAAAPSSTSSSSSSTSSTGSKYRPKQNIIIVKNINVLTHGIRMASNSNAPNTSPNTNNAPNTNSNTNNNNSPAKNEP